MDFVPIIFKPLPNVSLQTFDNLKMFTWDSTPENATVV